MTIEQLPLFDLPPANPPRVEVVSKSGGIHGDEGTLGLAELLARNDLVSVESTHIVLADPGVRTAQVSISELGSASPSPWTSWTRQEHVPELRDREGLTKYYRMKRNDGVVRGSLRMLKSPVQSAHWFMKPGSDSARDKKIAKFVQQNFFKRLNTTWPTVISDILLFCEYGYMPMEKVWKMDPDGKLRYRKLAPRHPMDVRQWLYDANGGPNGIEMEGSRDFPDQPSVIIPIDRLAVFSLEPEAGDLSGIPVLRSAYKHWFYKETLYKIDAIQKERHGIGIPVIKLPMGYSDKDKAMADNLGRNLRTNERAHVTLPPGWEIIFAKVEGQMVNCMTSIEHHDIAIATNVLGPFLKEPKVDSASTDMFLKSTRYIADGITEVFNRWIVPDLVDLNFRLGPDREHPALVARRIGEWEDARTMSFALRNFAGAGFIRPDDGTEAMLRDELDLPPIDEKTVRNIVPLQPDEPVDPNAAPEGEPVDQRQQGQRAGRPRQQNTPPSGPGRSNTGTDRSGK